MYYFFLSLPDSWLLTPTYLVSWLGGHKVAEHWLQQQQQQTNNKLTLFTLHFFLTRYAYKMICSYVFKEEFPEEALEVSPEKVWYNQWPKLFLHPPCDMTRGLHQSGMKPTCNIFDPHHETVYTIFVLTARVTRMKWIVVAVKKSKGLVGWATIRY